MSSERFSPTNEKQANPSTPEGLLGDLSDRIGTILEDPERPIRYVLTEPKGLRRSFEVSEDVLEGRSPLEPPENASANLGDYIRSSEFGGEGQLSYGPGSVYVRRYINPEAKGGSVSYETRVTVTRPPEAGAGTSKLFIARSWTKDEKEVETWHIVDGQHSVTSIEPADKHTAELIKTDLKLADALWQQKQASSESGAEEDPRVAATGLIGGLAVHGPKNSN